MGDRSRFDQYTEPELDELRRLCNFTPREREVFEARAKGQSVIEAQFSLCLSERTIERDSAKIRTKIARVQHHRRGNSLACEAAI
jgi:DNA-binding NarL/FixJ family response regulator